MCLLEMSWKINAVSDGRRKGMKKVENIKVAGVRSYDSPMLMNDLGINSG